MNTPIHTLLYTDEVGSPNRPDGPRLSDLAIPLSLMQALVATYGNEARLSPPQVWAVDNGIIESRRSFLISAPTNSGKTLIAIFRMFASAIERHSRHVFVVPLKALAEEKAEDFRALAALVGTYGGPPIEIVVSTGDYQRTNDFFGSPPPSQGQILICTPERLEVILRNPENHAWAREIDTYFIDEFHLLGDRGRGATVEILLTRLLVLCPDSSIVGLSATIGGIAPISEWLATARPDVRHCEQTYRFPMLRRNVATVEEKDAFVLSRVQQVLTDPLASILVFVYKKADAENLTAKLRDQTGCSSQVDFFHSGLSLADRNRVIQGFRKKTVRVLVTTTSLKMGVNTPATEVIVRDITFHGAGRLKISDLLQMVGRAGRGETAGQAWILVHPSEDATFTKDLASGKIDEIRPQLLPTPRFNRQVPPNCSDGVSPLKAIALAEVLVRQEADATGIAEFVGCTYSAFRFGNRSTDLQKHLVELERAKLIYLVENSQGLYRPTKLGRTVSISGLSPESGSMLAAFLRALIALSVKDQDKTGPGYLRRLTDLDLLFLAVASFEARDYWLAKPSVSTIEDCSGFVEMMPVEEKPLVNLWRDPSSSGFPTRRLLTSLHIPVDSDDSGVVEKAFYRILRTSLMLHQHSRGKGIEELSVTYGIRSGTFESGLKPTVTWVLSCLAQICDSDKAYKLDFLSLRLYELIEHLNLGATLGKLLQIDGIGRVTVQKLIAFGVVKIDTIAGWSYEDFLKCGIGNKQADTLARYCLRLGR